MQMHCLIFTEKLLIKQYFNKIFLSVFIFITVLCAFLCPFLKCNEFGQKLCNKIKTVLMKLDFGIVEYINQKKKERSGE